MKPIWKLTYEVKPSNDGEQTKKYTSFEEAKADIKNLISKIHISPYAQEVREGGPHKAYRAAMMDFLETYVSAKQFFSAKDPLPSCDEKDYPFEEKVMQNDADDDIDDDDYEDTDDLEDFEIYIGKDELSFKYYDIYLYTNMVVMDDEAEEYRFSFYADEAPKNKFRELVIELIPEWNWGTSSYPLLILKTLENHPGPLNQQQIISHIEATYDTTIERKAVGKNITLLKALGYNIQHNSNGYFIPKKPPVFDLNDLNAIADSIKGEMSLDDARKRELLYKLFTL